MNLEAKTTVYGHEFSMNVAVQDGISWNGKDPAYKHFCLIQLGDDEAQAMAKAQTIKAAMAAMGVYKFTIQAKPKVAYYSEEI